MREKKRHIEILPNARPRIVIGNRKVEQRHPASFRVYDKHFAKLIQKSETKWTLNDILPPPFPWKWVAIATITAACIGAIALFL